MRRLLMTAALVGSLVWMVGVSVPASARDGETSSLAGTVTTSNPNISSNYFTQYCEFFNRELPLQAAFYTMTPSATGNYFFNAVTANPGYAYYGVFEPTCSTANCLGSDRENFGKFSLEACVPYTFVIWLCTSGCNTDFTGAFTVTVDGPGALTWAGTGAASETPIPPWVQSYGRGAETDTCLAGWNPSWEEWPNGRKGGWVCTRSIPSLGSQTD